MEERPPSGGADWVVEAEEREICAMEEQLVVAGRPPRPKSLVFCR